MKPREKLPYVVFVIFGVVAVSFIGAAVVPKIYRAPIDVATINCQSPALIQQATDLLEESASPPFGKIKVLASSGFRENSIQSTKQEPIDIVNMPAEEVLKQILRPVVKPRDYQCEADIITSRGDMTMYYGWRENGSQLFIKVKAFPKLDED